MSHSTIKSNQYKIYSSFKHSTSTKNSDDGSVLILAPKNVKISPHGSFIIKERLARALGSVFSFLNLFFELSFFELKFVQEIGSKDLPGGDR